MSKVVSVYDLIPGTIVWVPAFIFWRHVGIVSDRWFNGVPMVISSSWRTGEVREEPWDIFRQGFEVKLHENTYPSSLPSYEVVLRARSKIGAPYKFTKNCEHLATFAHGLPEESPQLAATLTVAGIGVAVLMLGK